MATPIKMWIFIGFVYALYTLVTASEAQESSLTISGARASAIHECATSAARYPDYSWGNTEMYIYRSCMANRAQRE